MLYTQARLVHPTTQRRMYQPFIKAALVAQLSSVSFALVTHTDSIPHHALQEQKEHLWQVESFVHSLVKSHSHPSQRYPIVALQRPWLLRRGAHDIPQ
ncbi:hypothetical protein FJTKL_12922 [Diaporthe vaccinii]|uniref:Uncharacterized protein n=1 Tax=Diaporthe vaccinii TaxID=105482 RepID=A0ABR4FA29_9PEZI